MTRIIRIVGLALALATAGLSGCALTQTGGVASAALRVADTPLPPGWELCVLQGLSAPVTNANVSDLDEWQAEEGGSTNNTAAFNPFNTRRMTDASGAPIPGVVSANGFPAFATWQAGCAATVATLFQPNMWAITSALRSGSVGPAAAFLAVVDQSAWCAPSADGVPCYANAVLGVAGTLPDVLAHSAALDVYGNVKSDLHAYQQAVVTVIADQGEVTTRDQQLAAVQSQLATAKVQADAATRALRRFAIDEYVTSGLYASDTLTDPSKNVDPFGAQTASGVVAQEYLSVTTSDLLAGEHVAVAAENALLSRRDDAAKAVSQAAWTLTSDDAAERRSLTKMVSDVATMQQAGACTTVSITAPAPIGAAPSGAANTTTTTTTTPSTTTTTTTTLPTVVLPATVLPTTTVPSTSVPSTTTTSTTPATTTTTTTEPSTTTTSPAPTTTTTTTTVPSNTPSGTSTTANPAGVTALQGCVASLAPPAGP